MKTTLTLVFVALLANSAIARDATVQEVARILINNPLNSLKDYPGCNDNLVSATANDLAPGIISFELKLIPGGFCEPKEATVTVLEDRSDVPADGPATYSVDLKVSNF